MKKNVWMVIGLCGVSALSFAPRFEDEIMSFENKLTKTVNPNVDGNDNDDPPPMSISSIAGPVDEGADTSTRIFWSNEVDKQEELFATPITNQSPKEVDKQKEILQRLQFDEDDKSQFDRASIVRFREMLNTRKFSESDSGPMGKSNAKETKSWRCCFCCCPKKKKNGTTGKNDARAMVERLATQSTNHSRYDMVYVSGAFNVVSTIAVPSGQQSNRAKVFQALNSTL